MAFLRGQSLLVHCQVGTWNKAFWAVLICTLTYGNLNFSCICGTGLIVLKGLEKVKFRLSFCAAHFEIVKGLSPGVISYVRYSYVL